MIYILFKRDWEEGYYIMETEIMAFSSAYVAKEIENLFNSYRDETTEFTIKLLNENKIEIVEKLLLLTKDINKANIIYKKAITDIGYYHNMNMKDLKIFGTREIYYMDI